VILKEQLMALKSRHAVIGDVRGLGLMIGVEFESADGSHAPDARLRDRVMQQCFAQGLLLLSCGESTLRFCPPLIVTAEETKTAVEIFDAAVTAVA
jgi:4-aminobutyrate aminotransferase